MEILNDLGELVDFRVRIKGEGLEGIEVMFVNLLIYSNGLSVAVLHQGDNVPALHTRE